MLGERKQTDVQANGKIHKIEHNKFFVRQRSGVKIFLVDIPQLCSTLPTKIHRNQAVQSLEIWVELYPIHLSLIVTVLLSRQLRVGLVCEKLFIEWVSLPANLGSLFSSYWQLPFADCLDQIQPKSESASECQKNDAVSLSMDASCQSFGCIATCKVRQYAIWLATDKHGVDGILNKRKAYLRLRCITRVRDSLAFRAEGNLKYNNWRYMVDKKLFELVCQYQWVLSDYLPERTLRRSVCSPQGPAGDGKLCTSEWELADFENLDL